MGNNPLEIATYLFEFTCEFREILSNQCRIISANSVRKFTFDDWHVNWPLNICSSHFCPAFLAMISDSEDVCSLWHEAYYDIQHNYIVISQNCSWTRWKSKIVLLYLEYAISQKYLPQIILLQFDWIVTFEGFLDLFGMSTLSNDTNIGRWSLIS